MKRKVQAALAIGALALVLPVAVLLAGGVQAVGDERATAFSVAPAGAERARVVLDPGGGDLRLTRGSTGVLDGTFRTNVDDAEPAVDYRVVSREGVVRLEQGGDGLLLPWDESDAAHSWDLRLSGRLPLALEADLGAGDSELDLSGLDLLGFEVDAGTGATRIDLSGPRFRNLTGTIRAGAGDLEITLPRGVGARVTVAPGGGAVDPTTLRRDGDVYTNTAYTISKVTIDLTVEGAAGTITLRQEPDPVYSTPTPAA